jgi:hypothetical protein
VPAGAVAGAAGVAAGAGVPPLVVVVTVTDTVSACVPMRKGIGRQPLDVGLVELAPAAGVELALAAVVYTVAEVLPAIQLLVLDCNAFDWLAVTRVVVAGAVAAGCEDGAGVVGLGDSAAAAGLARSMKPNPVAGFAGGGGGS